MDLNKLESAKEDNTWHSYTYFGLVGFLSLIVSLVFIFEYLLGGISNKLYFSIPLIISGLSLFIAGVLNVKEISKNR